VPTDAGFQLDIMFRLLAASGLGAALGLEREVHGHPAGMRTHLLVALGAAVFTILSIYGFPNPGGTATPDRVAAQIVTGIGFLGAGAILKYGTNIRGLTTAGSLWVAASVGIAAGVGAYYLAAVASLIAVVALWPLHVLVQRLRLSGARTVRLGLAVDKLESFPAVSALLQRHGVKVAGVQSRRNQAGGHDMELELYVPGSASTAAFVPEIEGISGVSVSSITEAEEA
jgi:putative Mg2+ transporter-C (MgtC) family protein